MLCPMKKSKFAGTLWQLLQRIWKSFWICGPVRFWEMVHSPLKKKILLILASLTNFSLKKWNFAPQLKELVYKSLMLVFFTCPTSWMASIIWFSSTKMMILLKFSSTGIKPGTLGCHINTQRICWCISNSNGWMTTYKFLKLTPRDIPVKLSSLTKLPHQTLFWYCLHMQMMILRLIFTCKSLISSTQVGSPS